MSESIYSFLSGGGGFLPSLSTPTLPQGKQQVAGAPRTEGLLPLDQQSRAPSCSTPQV